MPDSKPRYGRLTYTSLHGAGSQQGAGSRQGAGSQRGSGSGGWQIKQEDGALTRAERQLLRGRVATQFDAGVEIPRFPTPAQIAALPRRLVYAPATPRSTAWWHTAPAGTDATGRPGNVFAQVVLDRTPTAIDPGDQPVRPIQLWRSPDWLTPYGAEQVNRATLNDQVPHDQLRPRPGAVITADTVINFLLDPTHFRLGVLAALLDATAAALAGGPRIVLITESTDRAALWIGAVSFLMAAPHAATFTFSTLERAPSVAIAFDQGVQLVCVPAVDAELLLAQAADPRSPLRNTGPLVVIDETELLAIGDLGGEPHRTQAGDHIFVTEWSVLAQVILTDHPSAQWALSEVDRLTPELSDSQRAIATSESDNSGVLPFDAVAWPLAVVVGRGGERFADALREAAAVVTRSGPVGLPSDSELHRTVRELIGIGLGRSAADAWRSAGDLTALTRVGAETAQLIIEAYVRRAIAEPGWLARPGPVPLPELVQHPADSEQELATPLRQAQDGAFGSLMLSVVVEREVLTELPDTCNAILADGALGLDGQAIAIIHLVDLLARCGMNYADPPEVLVHAFDRICHQLAPGQHAASGPPTLIDRIGPVSGQALRWVIRPVLAGQEWINRSPAGRRLDPAAADWLYPGEGPPPPLGRLTVGSNDPLRAELAHHRWTIDPENHPGERPLVVWSVLNTLAPYQTPPADVERYFDGEPWLAGDLLLIRRRWPAAVGVRQWAPTVKSAPADGDLFRLISDIRDPLSRGDIRDPLTRADIRDPALRRSDHRFTGSELTELRRLARDQYWLREGRVPSDDEVATIISGALWAWDLPGRLAEDAQYALICALVLETVRSLGLPGAKRLRATINSGKGFELPTDLKVMIKNCFSADGKERWVRTVLLADRRLAIAGVDRTAHRWATSLTSAGESLLITLVQGWADDQVGNQWERYRRRVAENLARDVTQIEADQRALAKQAETRLKAIAPGSWTGFPISRRGKGSQ